MPGLYFVPPGGYGIIFFMEFLSEDKVVLTKDEYMQLVASNERLQDAERRANAANKAKSDFLSSMSHEIRTPMNTVLGMNELIRMTLGDAELSIGEKISRVVGYTDGIQHSGEMLLYVINDILDISKIESGKFEIRPAPYHFQKLMEDIIPLFRINAEGKNLLFTAEIDKDLPGFIEGDEVRIRQIITNIVNNAVKYTKEGSIRMTVSGRRHGEEVIYDIAVQDTGIGIKSENLVHLFDSFERVDSAETHYIEGTGLGLAIVKNLLDLMGGSIEVDSEYGKGSVFTAHIPQKVLSEEKIAEYKPATGPVHSESRHRYYRNRKVLVVDDNMTNLTVAKSFLERMKADVDTVASGKESLKYINEYQYDIIFLDHMMPEMSGVKVLKEIRNNPDKYQNNINTPFIVMTANAIVGAREKYIGEYGFNGYIAKPFRFAELDRMMAQYMDGEETDEDVFGESLPGMGMPNAGVGGPPSGIGMPNAGVGGPPSGMGMPNAGVGGPPSGIGMPNAGVGGPPSGIGMPNAGVGGPPPGMGGPPPGAKGEVWDIDYKEGIDTCGDEETYNVVAEAYLEIQAENAEKLNRFLKADDWENYRIIVHALKSSSFTIGAKNFAGFSTTVENAAKNFIEGNDIERNLGYLRGSYSSYAAAYAAVCDNLRKHQTSG